ncbi:MAG: acyltransferase family protein [Burkholderiales bacterium]
MQNPARGNNFDLLRLVLATMVVYSHSFALVGQQEPIAWGRSLGSLAVHGFFAISGYLVCQSWMRSVSWLVFSTNRLLRIVPGLVVALVLSRFAANLCGNYVSNPVPYISNGPVWTLTWEVVAYAGLVALGLVGVLTPAAMPAFFASAWLVYLVHPAQASDTFVVIVPLMMMFASGAFLAVMEGRIDRRAAGLLGLAALALTLHLPTFYAVCDFVRGSVPWLWGPSVPNDLAYRVVYLVAFPLALVYLGGDAFRPVRLGRDLSYGVYVYGWPVAQMIAYASLSHSGRPPAPFPMFLLTMIGTLPLALASWHGIEKPALSLKRILTVRSGRDAGDAASSRDDSPSAFSRPRRPAA